MVLNAPHLHLVLNHFPLFATLFGLILIAYGSVYRSSHARAAGYIVLLVAALGTIPAFLSGSASEDVIEKVPGVTEGFIDQHEDAAKVSLILVLITGALAASAWIVDLRTKTVPRSLTIVTLAAALLTTASFGYTALLGGQIHHPEIRAGGATSTATTRDAPRE